MTLPPDLDRVGPDKPLGYSGTEDEDEALGWYRAARQRGLCAALWPDDLHGAFWVWAWHEEALMALLADDDPRVVSAAWADGESVGSFDVEEGRHYPSPAAFVQQIQATTFKGPRALLDLIARAFGGV